MKNMNLKVDLQAIQESALQAVDPGAAISRIMQRAGQILEIAETQWNLGEIDRVILLAVGKAAVPMAEAAARAVDNTQLCGCVVTKYHHAQEHSLPPSLEVIEAGHPLPDNAGIHASQKVIALLQETTERDLVLLLLSGGGSALLPAPVPGLTLEDIQATTDVLLRAGATIVEMNAVRKHMSLLKGGQLARLASPAPLVALILSDVVGDPLDVIASGPTAPDPTSYGTALSILNRYAALDRVPVAVVDHLKAGAAACLPETPKPLDPVFSRVFNFIVGSNALAAIAAIDAAQTLGYNTLLLSTFIEGEAREVGKIAGAIVKGLRYGPPAVPLPACVVWGGETTVTVRGRGKGGRNQELAVAAALSIDGVPDVLLLALATDGTDGPTDAAGAVVDGSSAALARSRGWDLHAVLADNNSYPLLADIGALLRLGPTGTNVNDLLIILVA